MTKPGPVEFDDFLLLVGKLNYSWTNTESLLIHLIAGLSGVTKEVALVLFLTLNTTRARLDLVQRLAKMKQTDPKERKKILSVTSKIMKQSALRNRYNHCIYAFDADGGNPRSILMRIADRKDEIKMGQVHELDDVAVDDVEKAIESLKSINYEIWALVREFNYPV